MNRELTQGEQAVIDLAVQHMKEQGKKFFPRYIATHGFGAQEFVYLIFGDVPSLGMSEHFLYMRTPQGYILVPEKVVKSIGQPEEISDFIAEELGRILKGLL
jgi:hypothetical protein